ncbi:MAG: glutaminyl-peptide cyclotransferase [Alistipes sp.]|nr:glutaminyl-peptide cyclotransferase [Alistipes senegalensis]MCM1249714.1 glutaminyl-peptide cyclotransferase [Alistipes sp.]
MKTFLAFPAALLLACGGGSARHNASASTEAAPAPTEYTYRVKASYPHPTDAYTQGLLYADGMLWEGTGQYGQSLLRKTDLANGRSETVARLPHSQFGEGIALLKGKLYQLTWHANTCHVYDAATRRKIREFRYPGEGWGLTTDGEKLYMTDGSAKIYTVDPATFRREKRTTVTFEGQPVDFLNELEWIEGKIWANVYTTDRIVIIDPPTGRVEGVVDLAGLLPREEQGPETDVLNGIAYDAATKRIFVTGKNWSRIFEIEIIAK